MSSPYEAQIEELRQQAADVEDGPTRIALLEEAVRLADLHQRVDLGFSLRKQLIMASTFGGSPERSLVHFSWRLAQCDREPGRFSEQDLLWEYKWILNSLSDFPQIPRQQIEEMLDDMTARYQRAGYNMRAVYKIRSSLAADMGNEAEAKRAHRLWEKTPRDESSDCRACDQNHLVYHHVYLGKLEKAVELAGPILQGRMRCRVVPQSTLGRILYPLVRLGRLAEAAEAHTKGYRLVRDNPEFLTRCGDHLQFLTWTDNLARAVKLFERHFGWALSTHDLAARFSFFLDGRFLFERLVASGQSSVKLRLSRGFAAFQESGRYDTAALRQWLDDACGELADRFDARNGNDSFRKRMKRAGRMWKRWVAPYPVRSRS